MAKKCKHNNKTRTHEQRASNRTAIFIIFQNDNFDPSRPSFFKMMNVNTPGKFYKSLNRNGCTCAGSAIFQNDHFASFD